MYIIAGLRPSLAHECVIFVCVLSCKDRCIRSAMYSDIFIYMSSFLLFMNTDSQGKTTLLTEDR